ncbi:efhc2 [Scenedesmus sp. PABB004]|nr:efhc2 [Scenedesmus sp. PABB004]
MDGIPKLPGYSVTLPPCLEKQSLGRKQTLTYLRGYQHEAPDAGLMSSDGPARGPGVGFTIPAAHTAGGGSPRASSGAASPAGSPLPKWVEQNGQVLRFFGYFEEAVPESRAETHRVRRVVVLYYLADDTLQARARARTELSAHSAVELSARAAPRALRGPRSCGVLVRRHQVERAGGGGLIAPPDLAVGGEVSLYGLTFRLLDADAFTRAWYADKLDVALGPAGTYPADPVEQYREQFGLSSTPVKKGNDLATFVEARLGKPSHLLEDDRLRQFLGQSGRVLRFYALWDDRPGLFGDRRPYVVHYYLEDDTVEVLEVGPPAAGPPCGGGGTARRALRAQRARRAARCGRAADGPWAGRAAQVHERNSGRDPFPAFLKRGPLPREKPRDAALAGRVPKSMCYAPADFRHARTARARARSWPSALAGARARAARARPGRAPLARPPRATTRGRLGGYVNVHSRAFLLHDCDAFTREWYATELGFPAEALEAVPVAEPIPPLPRPALPPYNGYGSLDDSRQNCVALVPKPPKKARGARSRHSRRPAPPPASLARPPTLAAPPPCARPRSPPPLPPSTTTAATQQQDMHKLMNKDKIILRFTAAMAPGSAVSASDAGRRFVLSYFLMDDSLLIFEPPLRNSGIVGGKFLERQRVYKPGASEEIYTHQARGAGGAPRRAPRAAAGSARAGRRGAPRGAQDLYVGGVLSVFGRLFELTGADEYSLTYMENNSHIFIMADVDATLGSLRAQAAGRAGAVRGALAAAAAGGQGLLTSEQLEGALAAAGLKFTRHQVISLGRRMDRDRTGSVPVGDVLAALGLA